MSAEATQKRMLLVSDTVLAPLVHLLQSAPEPPLIEGISAPYGQVYQVLMDPGHPAWHSDPDYLLVWTTPELTLPAFGRMLQFLPVSCGDILQEADQFASLVLERARGVKLTLVVSWTVPVYRRWIQAMTWEHEVGVANVLAKANLLLAEKFAGRGDIVLLDSAYWQGCVGEVAYDHRMYAIGKILYSRSMFSKAASEIRAVVRGVLGLGKKVVVCDLDNTLWGGVAADDGVESLRLGPPDPLGECYGEFQRALKALRSRGVLLAICSKNDEAFALSVIEKHPAMVLRKEDFVAWRINWHEKAENLLALANDLNLGLDSFVFLDDSPQERSQIKRLLPQVHVPDLPPSPAEYLPFLCSLPCFETASISREDLERTSLYQAERDRKVSLGMVGSVQEWLESLNIRVTAAPLTRETLPRAAQLLNKTNQFNLCVRRLEEQALWEWAAQPGNAFFVFQVKDRFGDFGLTGLASFTRCGQREALVADFVMSCRIMGKGIEEALLSFLFDECRNCGITRLFAPAVKTERNPPAVQYFEGKYLPDSEQIDPQKVLLPEAIRLEVGEAAAPQVEPQTLMAQTIQPVEGK